MIRDPKIPMSPGELPQKRIQEVISLPDRPADFSSYVGYGDMPEGTVSKNSPRNATYLCQVEWAWSPSHNRVDSYYLNKGRTHWSLWSRYLNDNDYPWKWVWVPVGCAPLHGLDYQTAAIHLLIDYWRFDAKEGDIDQFHWINEEGFLSMGELTGIAHEVWPEAGANEA
jgi:hypothetical protein